MDKAVTGLTQSPYYTTYVHFPHGTSLLGHNLTPFNGLLAIPLSRSLSLAETYNFLVVFSFVVTGVATFLLAFYLTRSYWSSIVAGCIFTFSNFHFTHAEGHLQLVATEWIPCFFLSWHILLSRPQIIVTIAAWVTLLGVVLCDYYYAFFCVVTACLMTVTYATSDKGTSAGVFLRKRLAHFSTFSVLTMFTSGMFFWFLWRYHLYDPWVLLDLVPGQPLGSGHASRECSLDFLGLLIPGGHWRFSQLTQWYWMALPGDINESSVHIGIAVLTLVVIAWYKRVSFSNREILMWGVPMVFFFVWSLGPELQIWGTRMPYVKLPYTVLEKICPPLQLTGVPIRGVVIVILSASIMAAYALKSLFSAPPNIFRFLSVLTLLLILLFEYLPRPLTISSLDVPPYVYALRDLPGNDGVMDLTAHTPVLPRFLYHQTVHGKPIFYGYMSRVPASVSKKDGEIWQCVLDGRHEQLYQLYKIRYLVVGVDSLVEKLASDVVYRDDSVVIYDLMKHAL